MIRTLLRRHLRHQRLLIAALIAAMVAFEVLIISIGSAMDRTGSMTTIIETLPPFLQKLIKTQIGEVAFPGFPAFAFEHPATMGLALAYVVFLATIPAGERDSGLLDLILARPLRRSQYLGATTLHVLGTAVVVPCSLLAGAALGLAIVENPQQVSWTRYLPASVGLMALLLAFGGITLLLGTSGRRRGSTVVLVVAAVAVTFLIHMLELFSSRLAWIAWASPFHYFDPIGATVQHEPWLGPTAILLAVFAVTTIAAFRRFEARDV